MTAHDPADDEGATEFDQSTGEESIDERVPTSITRRAKNGTLALLAGGLMLGRAARTIGKSRVRAVLQGIVGAGLVTLGLRQRRSKTAPGTRYSTGEPGREDVGATDVTIGEPRDESSGVAETPGGTDRTDEGTTGDEFGDVRTGDEPEDLGIGEESGGTGMDETGDSGMEDEPGGTGMDEEPGGTGMDEEPGATGDESDETGVHSEETDDEDEDR